MTVYFRDPYSYYLSQEYTLALPPQKIIWDSVRVDEISTNASVDMRATSVLGAVFSGGTVEGFNIFACKIEAIGRVQLMQAYVEDAVSSCDSVIIDESQLTNITADENIEITTSNCLGRIYAQGDVIARDCNHLGHIKAKGLVSAVRVQSIDSVQAHHVSLNGCVVLGNVRSKITPTIVNSSIHGALICFSTCSMIVVENSTIDTMYIRAPEASNPGVNVILRNLARQPMNFEQIKTTYSEREYDDVFVDGQLDNDDLTPCIVILKGNTKINEIVFVRLNGTVVLEDSSSISPSSVLGGRILHG